MTVVLNKPTIGGDDGAWGDELNADLDTVEAALNALQLTRTTVKTANYVAQAGDLVPADTATPNANITITLPTAPAVASHVAVKHIAVGAGKKVTVACAGSDVFDKAGGSTSKDLTGLGQWFAVQYGAGGIWTVVGDDPALSGGPSLPLSGGTLGGPLILNADATTALGAVTKQQLDTVSALTAGFYESLIPIHLAASATDTDWANAIDSVRTSIVGGYCTKKIVLDSATTYAPTAPIMTAAYALGTQFRGFRIQGGPGTVIQWGDTVNPLLSLKGKLRDSLFSDIEFKSTFVLGIALGATTTSAMSGARTTIPCTALPHDIPAGTALYFSATNQYVVTSADAAAGDTSIAVNSFTPSSTIASGTALALGAVTTTASLAGGTGVTTLPVLALPVAIPSGTILARLPTDECLTTGASAAVGATTITVHTTSGPNCSNGTNNYVPKQTVPAGSYFLHRSSVKGIYCFSNVTYQNQTMAWRGLKFAGHWQYGIGYDGDATANLNSEVDHDVKGSATSTFADGMVVCGLSSYTQQDQFLNHTYHDLWAYPQNGPVLKYNFGGHISLTGYCNIIHLGTDPVFDGGSLFVMPPGPHAFSAPYFTSDDMRVELHSTASKVMDCAWGSTGRIHLALDSSSWEGNIGTHETITLRGTAALVLTAPALDGWIGLRGGATVPTVVLDAGIEATGTNNFYVTAMSAQAANATGGIIRWDDSLSGAVEPVVGYHVHFPQRSLPALRKRTNSGSETVPSMTYTIVTGTATGIVKTAPTAVGAITIGKNSQRFAIENRSTQPVLVTVPTGMSINGVLNDTYPVPAGTTAELEQTETAGWSVTTERGGHAPLPTGTPTVGQAVIVAATSPLTLGYGTVGASGLPLTALKTANYTAAANEFVRFDTTSAARTLTLPTAPADGTRVGARIDTFGAGNGVTVSTGGSDVFGKTGGGTNFTLSYLDESVIFEYRAAEAEWSVVEHGFNKQTWIPLPSTPSDGQKLAYSAASSSWVPVSDTAPAAAGNAINNSGTTQVCGTASTTDVTSTTYAFTPTGRDLWVGGDITVTPSSAFDTFAGLSVQEVSNGVDTPLVFSALQPTGNETAGLTLMAPLRRVAAPVRTRTFKLQLVTTASSGATILNSAQYPSTLRGEWR